MRLELLDEIELDEIELDEIEEKTYEETLSEQLEYNEMIDAIINDLDITI